MAVNLKQITNQLSLAILSTDNSFGFGYRHNNNKGSDNLFIKKFKNDLCNNLIVDFEKFIPKKKLEKVNKISVSIGPANFNASRMVVVLARTISQQINCPLDSYTSFKLMAKRIAIQNNFCSNNKSFWIYKELKRKGFIAGNYEVSITKQNNNPIIIEKVIPKIVEKLSKTEPNFEAHYDDEEDLKELLNLSNKNIGIANSNSWEEVLPLYPLSPIH